MQGRQGRSGKRERGFGSRDHGSGLRPFLRVRGRLVPAGSKPPRRPVARSVDAPCAQHQAAAPSDAAQTAAGGAAVREPMRCGFGAVRVGALLGRVRLHLQTDRFLAVHRNDTVWEAGCLGAARALAEIVTGMTEEEMAATLPTSFGAGSSPFRGRSGARQPSDACDASLERSER